MPESEKYVLIKVTTSSHYYIPMVTEKASKINGWTIDDIIEDWFKRHDINGYHATRYNHRIGGADKVVSVEVVEKLED